MAMDWGVNNMDTGLWGGFHMLTIRNYLSNIVEYIYRNEDEKGLDNDQNYFNFIINIEYDSQFDIVSLEFSYNT